MTTVPPQMLSDKLSVRRAGELLKQIEPGKTGPKPELGVGDHTQLTREGAAREAGMSKHQHRQWVRLSNLDERCGHEVHPGDRQAAMWAVGNALPQVGGAHGAAREVQCTNLVQWLNGNLPFGVNRTSALRQVGGAKSNDIR